MGTGRSRKRGALPQAATCVVSLAVIVTSPLLCGPDGIAKRT